MVHHYSRKRAVIIYIVLALALLTPLPIYAGDELVTVTVPTSGTDPLGLVWSKLGQRLFVDGTVHRIGYHVWREGNATGDVTFSMYDVGTSEILFSKVWGDAGQLNTISGSGYQYVEVSPPLELNQEVRICVEYNSASGAGYCIAGYYSGDRITGQYYTNYLSYSTDSDGWSDIGEAEEGSYYLAYVPTDRPDPNGNGGDNGSPVGPLVLGGLIGGCVGLGAFVLTLFLVRKQKRK